MPDLSQKKSRLLSVVGVIVLFLGLFAYVGPRVNPQKSPVIVDGYVAWPESITKKSASLLVQDGGRVKPWEAYARFSLMKLSGSQSVKISDGKNSFSINSVAWFLDVLFRPDLAKKLPIFLVENNEIIRTIGLDSHDAKRDRYSYVELAAGRKKLLALAISAKKQNAQLLTRTEQQLIQLESNIQFFEALSASLDFARHGLIFRGEGIETLLGKSETRGLLTDLLPYAKIVLYTVENSSGKAPPGGILDLRNQLIWIEKSASYSPAIFPPKHREPSQNQPGHAWKSAGTLISEFYSSNELKIKKLNSELGFLSSTETLAQSALQNQFPDFENALDKFQWRLSQNELVAQNQGTANIEVSYYQMGFFSWAKWLFLFAFAILATSWLSPESKLARIFSRISFILCALGVSFLIVALVQRGLITRRPPVVNTYDTIIFVTTLLAIITIGFELVAKKKIALPLCALLGFLGMELARRYEAGNAIDNMDPLVAVLRSTFWLSTHVIVISIGYAAGFLASTLSHIYIFGRILGFDQRDDSFRNSLTRMVYGSICFALVFSLLGTILGGIWACESWGRFWGWDPKENGALMIVLWYLAILHARGSRLISQWGLHISAVFGGIVIGFAWWGVNMLGIGLHSYGFSQGAKPLTIFYGIEFSVVLLGLVFCLISKINPKTPVPANPPNTPRKKKKALEKN